MLTEAEHRREHTAPKDMVFNIDYGQKGYEDKMSFSSEIKERLCKSEFKCTRCAAAETAGIFRTVMRSADSALRFTTENSAVAERAAYDIKEGFGINAVIDGGSKNRSVAVREGFDTENIKGMIFGDPAPFGCCRMAYARGAFLGGGSVSDPIKNYHLEICVRSEGEAEFLRSMLPKELHARITERKGSFVVYLKGCEDIADFLGYIGAPSAALELFSVQVEKEMRNNINRRVNCESANADKMARAASKHIIAAEKIKAAGKWDSLPDTLREIGDLRCEFPEESLKELGERLDPPIGKSGVNHRLNRLKSFADNI